MLGVVDQVDWFEEILAIVANVAVVILNEKSNTYENDTSRSLPTRRTQIQFQTGAPSLPPHMGSRPMWPCIARRLIEIAIMLRPGDAVQR